MTRAGTVRYDPYRDLGERWPDVTVVAEALPGDLLGEVRDGGRVVALRRGTSVAQRRCTLAHEIVHLERGLPSCRGVLLAREETAVHAVAARRLLPTDLLAEALLVVGRDDDRSLAAYLEVDRATLRLRRGTLTAAEIALLRSAIRTSAALWSAG